MAGFVPDAYQAVLLEALAGKTAISTATLYLGLATAIPSATGTTSLSNIQEVAVAGYARVAVPAFGSATTTAPVKILVPTAFAFPAVSADMTVPARYGFLTTAASGTSGTIRYVFELAEPVLAKSGEPISVSANKLIIE